MKKTLIIISLLALSFWSSAQDMASVNFGQVYSSFRFKDSQGNADQNMSFVVKNSYGFAYERILYKGWFIRPELGYKNFGAQSSVQNTNLNWDLHYLDLSLGGGYIFDIKPVKPYIGTNFYLSYLLKGQQIVGSNAYDVKDQKSISSFDCGINLFTGLRYDIVENTSVFIECRWMNGLYQLDKNINGGSKELFNTATSFHLGVILGLNKPIKKEETKTDETLLKQ